MRRTIRRLTFVSDAPHFGGAERYIVDVAQAARRRGIQPHIHWARHVNADPDVFAAAETGGLHLTIAGPACTASLAGAIRAFRAMLGREQPDAVVINASGRPRHWLSTWLARQAGLPCVWVHQMVDACDHRRLRPRRLGGRLEGLQCWRMPQSLRHWLAAAAATAVVTLNAEDGQRVVRWQRVPREKIRVVPHGVDHQRFRFDAAGRAELRRSWDLGDHADTPFVVGSAGRLSSEKGVDLLIEAVALLHKRGVPVVAVVAGQGDQRDALKRLARQRGVGDDVRFVSFVEQMPAFYSALDAFVLSSRTESFGLALAEAMACERAVIATPTSGARDQIEHGSSGWLLADHSPTALADALAAVSRDPDGRKELGRAARESVARKFSIELTLERTLRALQGPTRGRSLRRWPGMARWPRAMIAAEDLA